jgi:hypothetical protein
MFLDTSQFWFADAAHGVQVPVVRVGRRVHLDRRDLDAWIEKNKY